MKPLNDDELIEQVRARLAEKESALAESKRATDELMKLNEKLRESERVKGEFLSNIRNEINNPLASIMALTETLINGVGLDRETVRSAIETIDEEAVELSFQLNNIFVASELEAGEAAPEPSRTRVAALIEDVINSTKFRTRRKNVEVRFEDARKLDGEDSFHTDAGKISLALLNLIVNAIEFSPDGGKVDVRAENLEGQLVIGVTDRGEGIPADLLDDIFTRFCQLETGTTKTHRGHGLGLSVAKAAVEVIGGGVEVESEVGEGSVFRLRLPEMTPLGDDDEISLAGNEELFDDDEGVELF